MRCIRWAFFCFLAVLHLADPQPVFAQSPFAFSDSPVDAPALIDADSIVYDNSRGVLTAEGNVIVVQGARALKAARIEYFEAEDRVLATGGVTILEPGGEVIKADRAELTDSLKRAIADNLGIRLSDGSRLVGRKVERVSGVRTTLTDGAFTPCAACAKDPDRAPVWRLRARKVEHNEVERDINYEDVTLDVAGVPVMYLPYFSHPDPTVKRRTGLLAPSLFFGGEFDAVTQVPYYWSIAPNSDLTFKPYFTATSAPVAALEYRHLFEDGAVRFDGSLGYLDRTSNDGVKDKNVTRGHAFVDGDFALDDTWKLTLAGRVASDDSFVETFKIDESDVL
ncbi:MAG: LPS-assembly protein LptD, partial [Alphaproteobacteria bacterium]